MGRLRLSESAIQKKLKEFSKSEDGKKLMDKTVKQHERKNEPFANGQQPYNLKRQQEAAQQMIGVLREYLPDSIDGVADAMDTSRPKKREEGGYVVKLRFDRDSIWRYSLRGSDGRRTGNGVENIVALLNNGYHAKGYVYGVWDHGVPEYSREWIRSRKDREGLYFMQDAVAEFNKRYGDVYHVVATVGVDYGERGEIEDVVEDEEYVYEE